MRKSFWLFLILVVIFTIVICFILPLKIPYKLKTPGKISTRFEWLVTKTQDNQIVSTLHDHSTGAILNQRIFQFERNDIINYQQTSGHNWQQSVVENDTIAFIRSNELERQMEELFGELQVAKATLDLYHAGEKESVIEEARKKIDYERGRADEQRRVVSRLRSLREQSLISDEEFESAENRQELFEIRVELAEAKMLTVSTGAQPELIRAEEFHVQSLQSQLQLLRKRISALNLVSPIGGKLIFYHDSDTLFSVRDLSEFCVFIPVPHSKYSYLASGQKIEVIIPESNSLFTGRVIEISPEVRLLNNKQVVFVVAALDVQTPGPMTGSIVNVRIHTEPVSLSEYLGRILRTVTFN